MSLPHLISQLLALGAGNRIWKTEGKFPLQYQGCNLLLYPNTYFCGRAFCQKLTTKGKHIYGTISNMVGLMVLEAGTSPPSATGPSMTPFLTICAPGHWLILLLWIIHMYREPIYGCTKVSDCFISLLLIWLHTFHELNEFRLAIHQSIQGLLACTS